MEDSACKAQRSGDPWCPLFGSQFFQGRNQIKNTLDLWEKDLEKASAGKKREK